jgi:hypothetical protein
MTRDNRSKIILKVHFAFGQMLQKQEKSNEEQDAHAVIGE